MKKIIALLILAVFAGTIVTPAIVSVNSKPSIVLTKQSLDKNQAQKDTTACAAKHEAKKGDAKCCHDGKAQKDCPKKCAEAKKTGACEKGKTTASPNK